MLKYRHDFFYHKKLAYLVSELQFLHCFVLQRKHILQLMIFLYGEDNFSETGGFSYSKHKDVAGM